jgi:hypothetical protein
LFPAAGVQGAVGVPPGGMLPDDGGGTAPGEGVELDPGAGGFDVVGVLGLVPGVGVVVLGGIVPGA